MIEGADRELFERSLRHAVESCTGAGSGSGPEDGDSGGGDPAALDAALVDLGWTDALSLDPPTAVSLLFEIQGSANACSTALDRVLAAGLSAEVPNAGRVLLPRLGQGSAPGTVDGDQLTVHGLLPCRSVAAHAEGTILVVGDAFWWRAGRYRCRPRWSSGLSRPPSVSIPTGENPAPPERGDTAVQVPLASLTLRSVEGVDPALDLAEVTGTVDIEPGHEPVDWAAGVALGQLAVGHELVGIARRMVDLAREHALDRIQFGRPIAGFQAVRHRLAEAFVAIEAADAALADAWLDGSPSAAAMAKATAGRGAQVAGRHCQQVLAGIGYTTEHPFHRYLRRALVLDQLLGSTQRLTRDLGESLLATRQVPTPVPL